MAQFPTGVAVVTTTDDLGRPRGMTVSSVCSVTLTPPTLLICLRQGGPTLEAVRERGTFALNLLHGRAQRVAELFASGDPDRFDRIEWDLPESSAGPHLSHDTHAVADCRVSRTESVGDHVVVFGETFAIAEHHGHVPLLYGLRQFRSWPPHSS
ncbi:oxidase [Protofrankia sp. BMG5.30]|nr:oxidase [Protofrankia sp. BMG5.30]